MAHHYVHLKNGVTTLDYDGIDVPDMAALRAEVLRTAAEILDEDNVDHLWRGTPLRLWVTDGPGGSGQTLLASISPRAHPIRPPRLSNPITNRRAAGRALRCRRGRHRRRRPHPICP